MTVGTIANFRNKKNFGRIVKRSGQGDSRLFDGSRVEPVEPVALAASRSRAVSSRGFQAGNYTLGEKEVDSSKGINFRVRRPSRSYLGQS